MHYLIGDLQGCCDALEQMLGLINFSPSRDHLYVLGDLVNRGPRSLDVLKRLSGLDNAATCLLGNHDLHLLAVAAGVRKAHRKDTLQSILDAPDREHWLQWLRHQRLAHLSQGWLMVHAGVVPQWDVSTTLSLAGEVEAVLRTPQIDDFLPQMYGNDSVPWGEELQGATRLRFIVNTLTRIRFCTDDGVLDYEVKRHAEQPPSGCRAWFDIPGRLTADTPIAFGHWSTLGLINRPDLLAIDTGCVWGGALTAVRIDSGLREVIQLPCAAAQQPGQD